MIKIFKKLSFSKFVSGVTMVALLAVLIAPSIAMAASVTSFSVKLSRQQASTASNQTILFTIPAGGLASGETIILTYDNSTAIPGAWDFEDADVSHQATPDGVCDTGDTEIVLAASPSGATAGIVDTSTTVITFTNGTTAIAAGSEMCFEFGTNAESVVTGVEQITNGPAGSTTLTLTGTMGTVDSTGTAAMSIIDDDTVAVTATVNSSITFDLDTTAADTCGTTESAGPYSVALGTITNSDTRVSGATDSVNHICVDLDTNASGGAVVTVNNANGASGLVSTSTPADDIDSTDGSVADNAENYGLCIVTSTDVTGNFDDTGGYDADTCAANSETNNVQALSTTPENILDTDGAPIATGRAQIAVNASITIAQPAHADYTDALTFIATGTF